MNRTTVNISDLSPKAQELYHKIMRGEYLTEQSEDIPLPDAPLFLSGASSGSRLV